LDEKKKSFHTKKYTTPNGEGLNALPILFVFSPSPALSHKERRKRKTYGY